MKRAFITRKIQSIIMFKVLLTLFTLLLFLIPVCAIDSGRWNLVAHQEIAPQQSFTQGYYTVTLEDREKNGLDDYTVIIYIEQAGNRQTELMRNGDTAFFDDNRLQLEYVGTRDDKQIFNIYEKINSHGDLVDVPMNVTAPVKLDSVNSSSQSIIPQTISIENSNLIVIGALILIVGFESVRRT